MAEITHFSPKKRRSPRIDMTAMVDVAFLLLTFFVLTSTMSHENMMKLTMPPSSLGQFVPEEKVMTLRIFPKDEIAFFVGTDSLHTTRIKADAIRGEMYKHLTKHQPMCEADISAACWDPMFVIEPQDSANYGTLVQVLDEIAILDIRKYAIKQ